MSIERGPFGANGEVFTITNAAGTALSVTDRGAAVTALRFAGRDIVLGWGDPGNYEENPGSFGATVGRSANRIAGAAFTLNGRAYGLAKNDGDNNLHSGPDGYHTRRWQAARTTENGVIFFMDSPDGDQGYPGHLRLYAAYTLTEEDEIRLVYSAECDADTILNPTNHTYFNLNGQGSGSILGHRLHLAASAFTPCGPGLIPTGEIKSVEGTPFNFCTEHAIGRDVAAPDEQLRLAGGYDNNFALDGAGLRPAAELTGEESGIALRVFTTMPGIQLYTGNFLAGERGKERAVYAARDGVCLETQFFPNAVNEPAFPSPILRAGERFRSETVWKLSKT